MHQRIGEHATRPDMQQAPILASQRILVALPKESDVARGFQIVQVLRIGAEFAVKELDGALVLFAAVDGHLLAGALGFERDAGHLQIQTDSDAAASRNTSSRAKPDSP